MNKVFHLTEHGKRELKEELAGLMESRRDVAEKIAEARSYGDLSENAEYTSAREEQVQVEARIAEIENILNNSDIIRDSKKSTIGLGSVVTVKNGATATYRIVGPVEADPLDGKISNESPLGQTLMGRVVGDKVSVKTPKGVVEYTIKSIE
jgi:transcription elongation factor GreA